MNFEGAKPISIPRYGSSCQWDDEVNLPLGLARIARNQRYTAQSTATRFGHSTRVKVSVNNALTGAGLLRYLATQPGTLDLQAVETILLFAYGSVDGNIYSCPPFIQGSLRNLTDASFFINTGFQPFTGLNPVMAQGFNQMFIALADLLLPKRTPLVYNSADAVLYPASDLPFGAPWNPGTYYRVGQVVSPSTFQTFGQTGGQGTWVVNKTGLLYRCTAAGTSGNVQPTWPTSYGGTVADGTTAWVEDTPTFISGLPDPAAPITPTTTVDAGSPIVDGATVYLACTLLNTIGEGTNALVDLQGNLNPASVLTWKNTTGGPVDLTVTMADIAPYLTPFGPFGVLGPLGPTYGATGINLYAFIDSDSSATPEQIIDPAFYSLVNTGGPLAAGATQTISAFPVGQQLPETSTAATSPIVGNVDTGIRYLTVFYQTQTLYQTGFSDAACFPVRVTQSGWPIQSLRLPIGPYNCNARVIASTVSGASVAGPYSYISQSDVESPGFNQPDVQVTSTMVADNTTSVATFNFTDTYLPGATDVTNYFDTIQLPPVVDVYFAKTLQRMVYTGAVGYQSGHLFSDIGQPERVRVPGGNFQVAENDGDRTVCYREIRGIGYSLKENSGYAAETNGADPSTWGARKVWSGNGPAGPAAIDIAGQDDSEFAVWAHRSGVYLFSGTAPQFISREQLDNWETINWDYGHLVRLRIDQKRRLVHILAPTNGSTVCNARFVINYFFGTGDPVVFVPRRGVLVPNVEGRKWSLDDLNFQDAVYIPQKSVNAVQQAGLDVENQMVFFSADGSIKTQTDGQYFDEDYNGTHVGYFSNWIGVLSKDPRMMYSNLAGARMWATGNGLCNVTAYDENDNAYILTDSLSPFLLTPGQRTRSDIPMNQPDVESLRWAIGMDNAGVAGNWWEVFTSDLMAYDAWPGLPG